MSWFTDEKLRLESFPVARERIFLAHAGVTVLPRCAADAMRNHVEASCAHHQEFGDVLRDVARTRGVCAKAIGAHADEIALLNELVNEDATARGRTSGIAEVPESASRDAAARTSANCSDQACSTPRASA